jgi:hypothetical protein
LGRPSCSSSFRSTSSSTSYLAAHGALWRQPRALARCDSCDARRACVREHKVQRRHRCAHVALAHQAERLLGELLAVQVTQRDVGHNLPHNQPHAYRRLRSAASQRRSRCAAVRRVSAERRSAACMHALACSTCLSPPAASPVHRVRRRNGSAWRVVTGTRGGNRPVSRYLSCARLPCHTCSVPTALLQQGGSVRGRRWK